MIENISLYYRDYETKLYRRGEENVYEIFQRGLDIIISLLGLIIGIPLMISFGLAIIFETPGPAIYSQERVGKDGKKFTIYKLRSMGVNAEQNGAQWAQKKDPRVTKVGAIIRKTRIDELPQIFNVLKGDMSIVGPRPERPIFSIEFEKEIPGFLHRLKVKPGITGYAQINGGYEVTPKEKWEADMYYINSRSILLDLKIIIKTIKIVLTGEGAR